MPIVVTESQRRDAIDLYLSGMSINDVAGRVGVNPKTANRIICNAGVKRSRSESAQLIGSKLRGRERPQIRKPVPQDVLRLYESGMSLREISAKLGKCRKDIARYLRSQGIQPDPILTKVRKFGHDGLVEIARRAAACAAGRRCTDQELAQRAEKKAQSRSLTGMQEVDLARELKRRGLDCIHQFPVGPYNLDIALESERVAIEVQRGSWHGSSSARRERLEYLRDRGWRVVFVQISRHGAPTDFGAISNKLVAFAQILRINPSAQGQYGVLRRNGEPATRLPDHFDDFARVPSL